MYCCSALKMPFQNVAKVLHPVSGATGRFAGGKGSSTFTHSQPECTGGFERRVLLVGRFARLPPGHQMDLSGIQSYNMAFSSECVDGLHLSSLPTACQNPNGYAVGSRCLCIQCHSLKKCFAVPSSGDTSLARALLSKCCEDREGQQFLSTNCSFSAARASSRELLCEPPLLEYDGHVSVYHGTGFSAQSYMRHHSVSYLRWLPPWKWRSLLFREIRWAVSLSSAKLTVASTLKRKLQVSATRTYLLGCSYRWATTPIGCAPPSEQGGRSCYKARLHGAPVTGVMAAANSPASIFLLAALLTPRILHTSVSASTSLQCSRPPCATRASSTFRQTRYISCTGNSSASSPRSPPHPKKKHPTSFCPYELPDNLCWNWWDMYIRGLNPDYLPRQRMFAYLSSHGVCVKDMDIHEIEEFTKYLEMRRVYGDKFPVFPYSITFEDKLEDLREKYPLEPAKTKKAKKPKDDSVS